jgi:hypothetical protein
VTVFDVAHAERAAWQRRAAAELARILEAHRDLPLMTWTVGAAGSVLVGQVGTLTRTGVRASFDAWRVALALAEYHEHAGDAVTYLSAKDHRNSVRVVLLADLLDDAGGHL